jgi:hypothetical protein
MRPNFLPCKITLKAYEVLVENSINIIGITYVAFDVLYHFDHILGSQGVTCDGREHYWTKFTGEN